LVKKSSSTYLIWESVMKFNILNNLKLWQKLGILLLVALLMMAFPFSQFYQSEQEKIDFAKTELTGIEPVRTTIKLIETLALHRGISTTALEGGAEAISARPAREKQVDEAIKVADAAMATLNSASLNAAFGKVKTEWQRVARAAATNITLSAENFENHNRLIRSVIDLIELIGDASQLTLDPAAHTYFLVQASLIQLPRAFDYMGQSRGLGAAALAEAARVRATAEASKTDLAKVELVSEVTRLRLGNIDELLRNYAQGTTNFVNKAMADRPSIAPRLDAQQKAANASINSLLALTRREIINSPRPGFSSADYFTQYSQGMDNLVKLKDETLNTLTDELNITIATLRRSQIITSALVLGFTILGVLIAYLIARNITGTVGQLQQSVERVRSGDLQALSAVESKDEVGDLGRTVNTLLQERIAAQQKAEDENDKLNNSVILLLTTVAELSQRNLTVKAPVTEDIIGTVSDSINQLTDATAGVLRDVTKIAGVVEHASKRVKQQSDAVNVVAESERVSVARMIETLKASTTAMAEVSALAQTSNSAAADASRSTESAMATVETTVRGMDAIRETISEMEKRIKRLGERSQEISQIVGLINTISERTHVLSLNASMQAAMAGDAGRGFAVVAEEVQRLAENSRQATAQIANLVQNIQIETNDTIATVNKTIDQVVQGSDMARSSGEKMRETRATTERLVQMVQTIAQSTLAQSKLAEQLQVAAGEISLSTEKTAEQLSQQGQVTSSLVAASQKLVDSVSVFKLPAQA
jgi:twitching motility protein PilJ